MNSHFRQAIKDTCLPADRNAIFLSHKPHRWDEFLDLDCAIYISHTCDDWSSLGMELWRSGLSNLHYLRLVEASGAVHRLRMEDGLLSPSPSEETWTLLLNWTHPKEGWRSRLPLWSKSYVTTRQSRKGQAMVERLEELGARAFSLPTIECGAPDSSDSIFEALSCLDQYDWLLFTSPNGVEHFFCFLKEQNLDHRALAMAKFACIGPGTSKALNEQGFHCDLLPKSFVAEGLLEELESTLGEDLTHLKILIPRAQEAREILPQSLAARGAQVTVAPVYKTVPPKPLRDSGSFIKPDTRVLFTSSSTVKNWISATGNKTQPCFCIGPITAQTAREAGLEILGVAGEHSIEGLVQLLLDRDGQNLPS